jgi:hypothetical protein
MKLDIHTQHLKIDFEIYQDYLEDRLIGFRIYNKLIILSRYEEI